jgi:seryl-tRNA synthetase
MGIDINNLRVERGGDPEKVREWQRKRFKKVEIVDQVVEKDNTWRELVSSIDNLKKKRNDVQKEIALKLKNGEQADELVAQKVSVENEIQLKESQKDPLEKEVQRLLNQIGNCVDPSVPISKDETENVCVRFWGPTPTGPNFNNHHKLLHKIGGYDMERGSKVAGPRCYFLRDAGVRLNQALINFGMDFLRQRGYTLLQTPFFMNKQLMASVAQLEQFDEELYKVSGDDDKYLIATSEQPICGFHQGEWIPEAELPKRYCGYSTCFRKEAGSSGKDVWGIFRVHQFEKIEQFIFCESDISVSMSMQDEMIATAEEFYKALGISYRVVNIVSGELNNAAIKKLDLEGWFPGYGTYRELVSCSNCTDYQARAMEIRCGIKKQGDKEKRYVHMLNATLCATTRVICCILENYQTENGIKIPEILVPYMGGTTFLPFIWEDKLASKGERGAAKKASKSDGKKPDEETKACTPSSKPRPPTQASKPKESHKLCNMKAIDGKSLEEMDSHLVTYSYLHGYTPSAKDAQVFSTLKLQDISSYANITRWMEHMKTFTAAEMQTW